MRERIAQAERLRDLIEQSATTVTSEDHLISVTIGPGNAVVALTIESQARRYSGEELGALIVQTVRSATGQAQAELAATAGSLLPLSLGDMLGGSLPELSDLAHGDDDLDGLDELDELAGIAELSGPDSPLAALRRMREELNRATAGYTAVRETLADLSITGEAGKGSVRATVRAGGVLTGIEIDDQAMRHGTNRLADLVVAAIRDANARFSLRMADAVAGLTGPRLDIRELVRRYQPDDEDPETDFGPEPASAVESGWGGSYSAGFGGGFGREYEDDDPAGWPG